jgi:DUF1009 family protein
METIGLIAGNRDLPFLFARRAKEAGYKVAAIAFGEETDRRLAKEVAAVEFISLGQYGKLLSFFKKHAVKRAVMQGQIKHDKIYSKIKPDWRAALLLLKIKNFRTEGILGAVAADLAGHGVHLQSAAWLMEPYLAGKGLLGKIKPSKQVLKDLEFGRELAKGVGALDIGQTVAVKRLSCVAVESIEGTDACIARAGKLGRDGVVVVKRARPKQDLRFDLPVVGPKTFLALAKIKAAAIGLEAGKTLMLDREKCLAIADRAGISVVAS